MYTTVYNSTISRKKTQTEACTVSSLCTDMRYFVDPAEQNCSIHNQIQVKVTNPIQSEGPSNFCFSCHSHLQAIYRHYLMSPANAQHWPLELWGVVQCSFQSTGLAANPHTGNNYQNNHQNHLTCISLAMLFSQQCEAVLASRPWKRTSQKPGLDSSLGLDWKRRLPQSHAEPFCFCHIRRNTVQRRKFRSSLMYPSLSMWI